MAVLGRKVANEDPVAEERQALADQRAAVEDLKRQLAERVAAVQEREADFYGPVVNRCARLRAIGHGFQ